MDTYEQLDALGTCFPWCTMPQEKPIKCKSSSVVTQYCLFNFTTFLFISYLARQVVEDCMQ